MKPAIMITAIAAVLICSAGYGAGLPETGKIVPRDTLVLVNVQNFDSLQTQWKKTSYYGLCKDPAMAGFVASFKSSWHSKWLKENDEISTLVKDINALPSGRLAIALVATDKTRQSGEPMLLVISQWSQANLAKVKTAVDKAVKKATDGGAIRAKDNFGGVEITTVTTAAKKEQREIKPRIEQEPIPTLKTQTEKYAAEDDADSADNNDKGNPGGLGSDQDENTPGMGDEDTEAAKEPSAISYCYVNDTMIVCEDKEVLKFTLARMKNSGEGTLGESADYRQAAGATGPVHDVDIYVNLGRLIGIVTEEDKSGGAKTQLGNFGLDNLGGLGMSIAVARTDGVPIQTKAVLKVNGAKKGLLKILEPASDAVKLPKFVDTSMASVTVMNFNIKGAYDEIFRIAGNISPGAAAAMTTPLIPAGQDGQGGVELKKDILDYLGNQVIVAESINRPFTASTDASRVVTAIAVTDAKALERSLSLVHSKLIAPGKPDAKRDFMGHTIYVGGAAPGAGVIPGMFRMATMADGPRRDREEHKFAFTIIDTHIIMGTQADVMQAIRIMDNKDSAAVSGAPWFGRAKEKVPARAGVEGFSDDRSAMEYMWWQIKEQQKGKAPRDDAYLPGSMIVQELKSLADFSLLPDFAKVKKYFGVSSYYIVSQPDGFLFESYMLDQK